MMLDMGILVRFILGGIALSSGVGLLLVPKLKEWLVPSPKATFLSDLLSFDRVLEDGVTILGKDGTLTQTLLIKGVDLSIKTTAEIEGLLAKKQDWLDLLSEMGATFKIITTRTELKINFTGDAPHPLLEKIHEAWMSNFERTYKNQHYLVLTYYPKKSKSMLRFLNKTQEGSHLKEWVSITLETLHDFEVKALDNGSGYYSPLLSFWSSLINGETSSIASFRDHLSERLVYHSVQFDKKSGVIQYGVEKQFAAIVSLKCWGEISSAELLREIQTLPSKLVIMKICKGYSKLKAITYLKYQRKQSQLLFENRETDAEFENAIDMINAKEVSLYDFQLSVFIFANKTDLEKRLSDVKRIFRSYGCAPIVETMGAEWIWRSQFPGLDHFLRPSHPLSHNLAYLMSFDKEPVGLARCDWGDGPLRLFRTPTGGAYSLQLHISEEPEALAHSLVVAPTGSGKTTLYQHLIGGALSHKNLRAYIFDRYNGTRIFTQSMGGTYVDLSSGVPLNPFICEESDANKAFLQEFLLLLSGCSDDESHEQVSNAVNILFRIPKEERVLSNIFESVVGAGSAVRTGLAKWVGDKPLARWFNGMQGNNAFDALDMESDSLVSFEMTDVLGSPETSAAVTHYIMHRIRSTARQLASPHLIFIDETRPMLSDPVFAKNVETLFFEHRKLRGSINVCFQDAQSIIATGIGSIILQQCPTRFLFQNFAAEKKDYEMFNLTDSEWEYIKGTSRISRTLKRSVLVKKLNESVILDIDLSGLGPLLQLYRSGSEPVRLVRELQQQWGMENWTEKYLNLSL